MTTGHGVQLSVLFLKESKTLKLQKPSRCMRSPYFQTTCLLPLLACALSSFCLAHSELRGVHPSFITQYSVKHSASFSCGDGSSISWERVNDDHCDCASGADEPGTSGMQGSSAWRYIFLRFFLSTLVVCIRGQFFLQSLWLALLQLQASVPTPS
jgi:hypothetical protein